MTYDFGCFSFGMMIGAAILAVGCVVSVYVTRKLL